MATNTMATLKTTTPNALTAATMRKLEAAFLAVLVVSGAVHLAAVVIGRCAEEQPAAVAALTSAAEEQEAAEAWALAETEGRVIHVGGADREPGDEIARTASR